MKSVYTHAKAFPGLSAARPVALISLALVLLTLPLAATAHADPTISYDEYQELIARARSELRAARSGSADECEATLARIAAELEAVTVVRMPDGTLMPVDNCGLAAALRGQSCDIGRAESFLSGLGAGGGARQSGGEPVMSPGGKGAVPDPMALSWLRHILEDMGLLPRSNRPSASGGQQESPGEPGASVPQGTGAGSPGKRTEWPDDLRLLWLIAGAGLLFLGGGLALEIRRWWIRRKADAPQETALEDETLAPAIALDRAERLAGAGRYREAMRYLYLSLMGKLDGRGQLRFDDALTNQEVLRQIATVDLASRLAPVVATFDRVWYGVESLDRPAYETFAAQVAALARE